jgi:hypothetical protein
MLLMDGFSGRVQTGSGQVIAGRTIMIGDESKTTQIPARSSSLCIQLSVDSVYDSPKVQSRSHKLPSRCGGPWPSVPAIMPALNGARNPPHVFADRFEVGTLINIRITRAGLKVKETARCKHSRSHSASNLNSASNGRRLLRTIFAEHYYQTRRAAQSKNLSAAWVQESGCAYDR